MLKETIKIWEIDEYNYSMAFGFLPNITTYICEEEKNRPFFLVVPGGGYGCVSSTEAEIVAMKFYEKGYNVGVLTYTTNLLMLSPLNKQPMNDLGRAIRYIRKNISENVTICGFSAGGHLCGTIAVHYDDCVDENPIYKNISAKPNAVILSYPVINAFEFAHKGSFQALIGLDVYDDDKYKSDLEYFSLEKHVKRETPPTFIWHTATDEAVPVENTMLFTKALIENNVHFACHIFSKGKHGLSLANEAWVNGDFGEQYTEEQTSKVLEAVENDIIPLPNDVKIMLKNIFSKEGNEFNDRMANNEVAEWVNLAEEWLKDSSILN